MSRCPPTEIHQSRGSVGNSQSSCSQSHRSPPSLAWRNVVRIPRKLSSRAIKETFKSWDNVEFYGRFNPQYNIRKFRWKKFWQKKQHVSDFQVISFCRVRWSKLGIYSAENDCIEIGTFPYITVLTLYFFSVHAGLQRGENVITKQNLLSFVSRDFVRSTQLMNNILWLCRQSFANWPSLQLYMEKNLLNKSCHLFHFLNSMWNSLWGFSGLKLVKAKL